MRFRFLAFRFSCYFPSLSGPRPIRRAMCKIYDRIAHHTIHSRCFCFVSPMPTNVRVAVSSDRTLPFMYIRLWCGLWWQNNKDYFNCSQLCRQCRGIVLSLSLSLSPPVARSLTVCFSPCHCMNIAVILRHRKLFYHTLWRLCKCWA